MPAGNINQFILKMSSYATSLARTRGLIAEFVNPKYKDASKTTFKSSTRLECMMQDYPKALGSSAAIGFTVVNQVGQLSLGMTCICCRFLHDLVGQLCRHRLISIPPVFTVTEMQLKIVSWASQATFRHNLM